jgi:polyhydroxyalkanoate synthesis regulator phasin
MARPPKPGENAGELARNISLAGLVAYGKAWDQAQDRFQQAEKNTEKLFEDLVSKGQKLEEETQKKVQEVADITQSFSIEDRIQKVRESFGLSETARDTGDIDALKEEIAALQKQVKKLNSEVGKLKKDQKPVAK